MAAPPDLAGVPDERGLQQLISQCLAKSPDDRPTLAAIMDRLSETGTPADPVSAPARDYPAAFAAEPYTPTAGPAQQAARDPYGAPSSAAPSPPASGPAPPAPAGPQRGSAGGPPAPPKSGRPRLRLPRGGLPRLRLPRRARPRLSDEAELAQGRGEPVYGGYRTRPAGESRYANAAISDARSGQPWSFSRAIQPEDLLLMRVDIGPPSSLSQVQDPVPFPDWQLPAGDLVMNVVVTSTTFTVGPVTDGAGRLRVPSEHAHASHFVLPSDGGPARAADGGPDLTFVLGAPRSPGPARLRIIYYFRGAIIQSQLLTAVIAGPALRGGQTPPWSLVTDYTISHSLPSAAQCGTCAGHWPESRSPRQPSRRAGLS